MKVDKKGRTEKRSRTSADDQDEDDDEEPQPRRQKKLSKGERRTTEKEMIDPHLLNRAVNSLGGLFIAKTACNQIVRPDY